MPGSFIDLDLELGQKISTYVADAAKEVRPGQYLEPIFWHQGDSVWFLQDMEKTNDGHYLVRRVQITPYETPKEGRRLYFVPQVFSRHKTGESIKTRQETPSTEIGSLSLKKVPSYGEFLNKVRQAWKEAESFPQSKLDEVIRP